MLVLRLIAAEMHIGVLPECVLQGTKYIRWDTLVLGLLMLVIPGYIDTWVRADKCTLNKHSLGLLIKIGTDQPVGKLTIRG